MLAEATLTELEAIAIARALTFVAEVNGIHPREAGLLAAFWEDAGGDFAELHRAEKDGPISPEELARALPGEETRALFLKLAFLLSTMDGTIRDGELSRIHSYAEAFGTKRDFLSDCEKEARRYLEEHVK